MGETMPAIASLEDLKAAQKDLQEALEKRSFSGFRTPISMLKTPELRCKDKS
jgi:hypothetical protein